MPVSWPTDIYPYRCDFYLQNNTSTFTSPITRTTQRLRFQGSKWLCEASFHLDRQKSQRIDALLDSQQGAYGSFYLWDFARDAPYNGTPAGSQTVTATYARGVTSVAINGLPLSQTWLIAGDLIQIADYLYRITADIAANGSGVGTATLNRGLVEALSGSNPVTLTRPRVEMMLRDDDQPRRSKHYDSLYEYSLQFVEVLPAT
jgi:hypothetical protein